MKVLLERNKSKRIIKNQYLLFLESPEESNKKETEAVTVTTPQSCSVMTAQWYLEISALSLLSKRNIVAENSNKDLKVILRLWGEDAFWYFVLCVGLGVFLIIHC